LSPLALPRRYPGARGVTTMLAGMPPKVRAIALFVPPTTVNGSACPAERTFPAALVWSNVEIVAAYVPGANEKLSEHWVLASVAVQPFDVGVRLIDCGKPAGVAVEPVPVTLIVRLCVAAEIYWARRIAAARVAVGIVIVNCVFAEPDATSPACAFAETGAVMPPPPLHALRMRVAVMSAVMRRE